MNGVHATWPTTVFQDAHAQVVLAPLVPLSMNDCDLTFNFLRHYIKDHFFLKME